MSGVVEVFDVRQIPVLLRGETAATTDWIQKAGASRLGFYVATIFLGAGLYGAAMGYWRSPLQAEYTAIKLPLVLLLTTAGNALLNGMLAPLLGLNIGFRQTSLAILMSFTIAAVILGSFSPIIFFLVWNTPPVSAHASADFSAYSVTLLVQVAVIAFAGIAANLRLVQLLHSLSGSKQVARRVLFAWLAANLFFGSQVSWILRPFIGSPGLPTEFLRADAWHGSFYEAVFFALRHLLSH